eukprot:662320-Pelagomonas_calceolata.AAC.1
MARPEIHNKLTRVQRISRVRNSWAEGFCVTTRCAENRNRRRHMLPPSRHRKGKGYIAVPAYMGSLAEALKEVPAN